jgi:hypothetical protein
MARQRTAAVEPEINIRLSRDGVQNIRVLADTPAARDAGLKTLLRVTPQIDELERALKNRLYSVQVGDAQFFSGMERGVPMLVTHLGPAVRVCQRIADVIAADLREMGLKDVSVVGSPFNESTLFVGPDADARNNFVYRMAMGLPEPIEQ